MKALLIQANGNNIRLGKYFKQPKYELFFNNERIILLFLYTEDLCIYYYKHFVQVIVINVPMFKGEALLNHTVNHYLYQMVSATLGKVTFLLNVYIRGLRACK